MSYEAELAFGKDLAHEAGKIMLEYFYADKQTLWKSDNSPVTLADTTINKLVIENVKREYPDHNVIGEEESFDQSSDYSWVCDPIDGTVPYSLSMPVSTFCLALVKRGITQVAVVYDPFEDRLFHATKGGGAYVNDAPLSVSKSSDFQSKYVAASDGLSQNAEDLSSVKRDLRDQGARIVSLVSFAYVGARVATGEMAAAYMAYGSPWDAAAISLIVQEAGGKATDLGGMDRRYDEFADGILLSNGTKVHDKIVEVISNARSRN